MPVETNKRQGFLSGAVLKSTAYITMFIDHFFAVVYLAVLNQYRMAGTATDNMERIYSAGRAVGRISFILFAYLAVEGFLHTRSRKKYLLRLGVFAFVSEIPFDLTFSGSYFDPASQNVFFTLFLGILALTAWEWTEDKLAASAAVSRNVQSLILIFCSMAAYILKTDYKYMGVLLIFTFYQTRGQKLPFRILAAGFIMLFGTFSMNCIRYSRYYSIEYLFLFSAKELYGLFAFVPIGLYNGAKGRQLPKALCYGFYPVHLLALHYVSVMITGMNM